MLASIVRCWWVVSLAVRLCAACYHSTPVTRRPEAHHVRCPESFVDTWWIRLASNGIQMHEGHLNQTNNVPRAQPCRQTLIRRHAIDNRRPGNQSYAWNDTGARSGSTLIDTGCNAPPKYPKLGLNLHDRMMDRSSCAAWISPSPERQPPRRNRLQLPASSPHPAAGHHTRHNRRGWYHSGTTATLGSRLEGVALFLLDSGQRVTAWRLLHGMLLVGASDVPALGSLPAHAASAAQSAAAVAARVLSSSRTALLSDWWLATIISRTQRARSAIRCTGAISS